MFQHRPSATAVGKTLIEQLLGMPPHQRVEFIKKFETELEHVNEDELTRIGTLLCHASPNTVRKERPIIGDYKPTEQSEFDTELFGDPDDPDKPGTYVSLVQIGEEEDGSDEDGND